MLSAAYRKIRDKLRMRKLHRDDVNQWRIETLRRAGARIGEDCLIFTTEFSTEPYLVTIGNHVVVASGTQFITHDGAVWLIRDRHPNITVFGRISVGDNSFIGINCLVLPNTSIGSNCIIGAGAVVRGKIPDNSVVMGNPGKVVLQTPLVTQIYEGSPDRVDTKHLSPEERKRLLRAHYNLE
jgi:acetyltransferase-like isoleucine patch superfamily enzyme